MTVNFLKVFSLSTYLTIGSTSDYSLSSTNDTLNISSEIGVNTYDNIVVNFTPTLTYTDGVPNEWVSGEKELKIEGYELEDDEYRLVISASGGDSTAHSSFKVSRTENNNNVEQVNKDRAKKTAEGSSLSNDSSLFYNDKLSLSYTNDTKSYHVVSDYPKLIGGDGSELTADKDGICTIGDYAHNAVVNASIVYAVNEYPLTINYGNGGNGGSVSVNGQTASTKITYGKEYTVSVTPEKAKSFQRQIRLRKTRP